MDAILIINRTYSQKGLNFGLAISTIKTSIVKKIVTEIYVDEDEFAGELTTKSSNESIYIDGDEFLGEPSNKSN